MGLLVTGSSVTRGIISSNHPASSLFRGGLETIHTPDAEFWWPCLRSSRLSKKPLLLLS
jgi:hypothetical protein